MADLARLYEQMNTKKRMNDPSELMSYSVMHDASNRAWERFTAGITDKLTAQITSENQQGGEALAAILKQITPMVQEAIKAGVADVLKKIDGLESLDEVKRLIKGVRVPDHRQDLAALAGVIKDIKIPKTDLSPVLLQLDIIQDALEEEEKAKTITWDIERDPITKLLKNVTARVTEE